MIRWMVALGCLVSSAAAQEVPPTDPVRLSPRQVEAVKNGVRDALKDPESAHFGDLLAARSRTDGAIMVCGFVNARNSYGGYTGRGYFIGVIPPGGGRFAVNRVSTERDDYLEARATCGAVGLALD